MAVSSLFCFTLKHYYAEGRTVVSDVRVNAKLRFFLRLIKVPSNKSVAVTYLS